MDKIMIDMINGAIVYASILSGCEYIKDECKRNPYCFECVFYDKVMGCMFRGVPNEWNLETIEKELKKSIERGTNK